MSFKKLLHKGDKPKAKKIPNVKKKKGFEKLKHI